MFPRALTRRELLWQLGGGLGGIPIRNLARTDTPGARRGTTDPVVRAGEEQAR
jgi:hypothetical protein